MCSLVAFSYLSSLINHPVYSGSSSRTDHKSLPSYLNQTRTMAERGTTAERRPSSVLRQTSRWSSLGCSSSRVSSCKDSISFSYINTFLPFSSSFLDNHTFQKSPTGRELKDIFEILIHTQTHTHIFF